MRIVRPGSVVGPQQQYMYLKQLEWAKWAAADEMRKLQKEVISSVAPVVTPVTPPAETDEDTDMVTDPPSTTLPIVLPSTPPQTSTNLPPVTPSRHIAAATAKAGAIEPPGQPRKTPAAKRVASDSDQDEEDDCLPALGVPPVRRAKAKASVARPIGSRITASEQRPARVTRSTAAAAATRKAGTSTVQTLKATKANGQAPNKIPRLGNGATARGIAASKDTEALPSANTRSRTRQQTSPTPSRLPTLISPKRPHHNSTASVHETPVAVPPLKAAGSTAPGSWMTNNAAAVVVPAGKSGRPGPRAIRRRRSSFSAADIVA